MANMRPGNQERGWNDPPFFDYASVANVQSSPRRTLLNKRVAYPTTSPQQNPPKENSDIQSSPPLNLFVPGAESHRKNNDQSDVTADDNQPAVSPVPNIFMPVQSSEGVQNSTSSEPEPCKSLKIEHVCEEFNLKEGCDKLQFVLKNFSESLDCCEKFLQIRAIEEIRKKVDVFKGKWNDDKLSRAVQEKMVLMAAALKQKNFNEAHNIHISLMVDHTSEVNVWLVGMKRVVETLRQNQNSEKIGNIAVVQKRSEDTITISESKITSSSSDIGQDLVHESSKEDLIDSVDPDQK